MANSYTNLITFILTTLFYYIALKPNQSLDTLSDPSKYQQYMSSNYLYLAIYLLLVIVVQFIVNSSIISTTCGGSISENMGAAGLITFIPWILIFGVIIVILVVFPGFKSAFSDVVGYYYVSGSANKVLTELLINRDLESNISGKNISPTEKTALEDAADAIVKICGNTSILINQIVPDNFSKYWEVLKPIMKPKYQNDNSDTLDLKNQLFELVVTRDNVGEAMWYLYTGFLLVSLVQLKISLRGCKSNTSTMTQNYQAYQKEQEALKQKQQVATNTTYTITS
jgi:hypothetical protein